MNGTPITTSALAGIGPAPLNSEIIFSHDATVPLAFQLPPRRYVRVPSGAADPFEDPAGRLQDEAKVMMEYMCRRDEEVKIDRRC